MQYEKTWRAVLNPEDYIVSYSTIRTIADWFYTELYFRMKFMVLSVNDLKDQTYNSIVSKCRPFLKRVSHPKIIYLLLFLKIETRLYRKFQQYPSIYHTVTPKHRHHPNLTFELGQLNSKAHKENR